MKASSRAIELIKISEAFKTNPYLCPAGVPTIGYGSTRYEDGKKISLEDAPITRERAEQLLLATLATEYESAINRYITTPINQNQFDALVDFAYNMGTQALRKSTLLRYVNERKFITAAAEFKKWIWADGKKMAGLIIRREAERRLFLSEAP